MFYPKIKCGNPINAHWSSLLACNPMNAGTLSCFSCHRPEKQPQNRVVTSNVVDAIAGGKPLIISISRLHTGTWHRLGNIHLMLHTPSYSHIHTLLVHLPTQGPQNEDLTSSGSHRTLSCFSCQRLKKTAPENRVFTTQCKGCFFHDMQIYMGTQDLMRKRWMTEAEAFLPRWHDVINPGS